MKHAPNSHLQVLSNIIDWGDNAQEALDAPRFCIDANGPGVSLEPGLPTHELRSLGHSPTHVLEGYSRSLFGRGQIILRDKTNNVLCIGSDGRADGLGLGL